VSPLVLFFRNPFFSITRARLSRFATLNLAGAIGVALGFLV